MGIEGIENLNDQTDVRAILSRDISSDSGLAPGEEPPPSDFEEEDDNDDSQV